MSDEKQICQNESLSTHEPRDTRSFVIKTILICNQCCLSGVKTRGAWDQAGTILYDALLSGGGRLPAKWRDNPEVPIEFPDIVTYAIYLETETGRKVKDTEVSHRAALFVTPAGNVGAVVAYESDPHRIEVCSIQPINADVEIDVQYYGKLRNDIIKRGFQPALATPERAALVDNWVPVRSEYLARLVQKPKGQKTKEDGDTGIALVSSSLPVRLPMYTFIEVRQGTIAISDGRDGQFWEGSTNGELAAIHQRPKSPIQSKFKPNPRLLEVWGDTTEITVEKIIDELGTFNMDAILTYFVCVSWALQEHQVDASIDTLIEAIGRGVDARRSSAARAELRRDVWRWLLMFDSLEIIGARNGTWREPHDGNDTRKKLPKEALYSQDSIIKIIGTRNTGQGSFDNSTPPKEVTFVAGPWVSQWRGNREILSDLGNIRDVARIPRGKPSGTWAACIALVLTQKWREQAARAAMKRTGKDNEKQTLEFEPFTRRGLLLDTWRSDADVEKILFKSDKPHRAKEYWEGAIKLLKKNGQIGFYKEIENLDHPDGYRWQDDWLDQKLDIRPSSGVMSQCIEIHQSAKAAKKRTGKGSKVAKVA